MTAKNAERDSGIAGHWVRNDDALVRRMGNDVFVAAPGLGTIHALNTLASAVWHALEAPRSYAELCRIFEAAFPEVESRRIHDDLLSLLKTLENDGLISHMSPADPCR